LASIVAEIAEVVELRPRGESTFGVIPDPGSLASEVDYYVHYPSCEKNRLVADHMWSPVIMSSCVFGMTRAGLVFAL